jgi:hypothetical protein
MNIRITAVCRSFPDAESKDIEAFSHEDHILIQLATAINAKSYE